MPPCGAKTKKGTGACQMSAMANGRCKMHGGMSTGPKSLPAGGRRSTYLPRRLAALWQQAATDDTLLDLHSDLVLVETRLTELLGQLDEAASPTAWNEALDRWSAWNSDPEANPDAFAELGKLLHAGAGQGVKWHELLELLEARRRVIETETRRRRELRQYLDAREAMLLAGAVIHTINRHVSDPDVRTAISLELARLMDPPGERGDRAAEVPRPLALPG